MAQATLKISLRKRFDGMLFGDLAELADKASKYKELLREEQHKRNSSKGTYYKTPSSSIHLVVVELKEETEGSEEREIAVAEMAKWKHPISCKALTKPPKDQKTPPYRGGFVLNKSTQNKVYSFDLTKVDALFDEMLLQKAIETPHRCHTGKNNSKKIKTSRITSLSYNRSFSPTSGQHGQLQLARTEERQTSNRS
ncbi:unnamed protein product [Prunus brigantina]